MTTVTSDPSSVVPPYHSQAAAPTTGAISANEKYKFSPVGHELALTSHDGKMTVWDAQTGQVKHQYIPSKHLSAVCTCLSWMPLKDPTTIQNK